jgi:hypothetical protein
VISRTRPQRLASVSENAPRPELPKTEAMKIAREIELAMGARSAFTPKSRILDLLQQSDSAEGGVGPALFELKLRAPQIVDKLVRRLTQRNVNDVLDGQSLGKQGLELWSLFGMRGAVPERREDAVRALRSRAQQLASRQNREVRSYARDRLEMTDGSIRSFNEQFQRLEPMRRVDHFRPGEKTLGLVFAAMERGPMSRLADAVLGVYDPGSSKVLARVLSAPKVTDASGAEKSFGDLTVLVNGSFNMMPSPAFVFRTAMHTEGAVVIASSNPAGPDAHRLRELSNVQGVPVPAELRGKIWAIGNLEPSFMTWPQATDLLLEQLGDLNDAFGRLRAARPALANKPNLKAATLTLVGFSSGAMSAVAARKELETHGLGTVVDRLVTVAGALSGSPFADVVDSPADLRDHSRSSWAVRLAPLMGTALEGLDHQTGRAMFNSTDPDAIASWRHELGLGASLVDLAYVATADSETKAYPSRVEPWMRMNVALLNHVEGHEGNHTDGMVYDEAAPFAQEVVKDPLAKTHVMEWKDPDTVDVILRALK